MGDTILQTVIVMLISKNTWNRKKRILWKRSCYYNRLHATLCKSDPIIGGMQAVCEATNIACRGKPLAITNNLNFGNPDKKNVMGEIVGSIKEYQKLLLF